MLVKQWLLAPIWEGRGLSGWRHFWKISITCTFIITTCFVLIVYFSIWNAILNEADIQELPGSLSFLYIKQSLSFPRLKARQCLLKATLSVEFVSLLVCVY